MTNEKISREQFQGIWRKLKSQLTTPHEWAIDRTLEDDATEAMWEELSRFEYAPVSAAAREYLEGGETKFPTWGQLLARIRAKMQVEQIYPKRDTVHPAQYISRGSPRELIATPEWRALCATLQVDPVLAFDDWPPETRKPMRERSA